VNNIILFGKTPLEAQNDYIFKKLGGIAPLAPLATPMCAIRVIIGSSRKAPF